jgi:hypothetical protein
VTSPYSSNLLQQTSNPGDAPTTTVPRPGQHVAPTHVRSVTHVVPQAVPVPYAPAVQPVYAQPAAPRGGAVSALLLALVVVLVGAAAFLGGYYATKQASPSAAEANIQQRVAAQGAYDSNRTRGIAAGRADAVAASSAAGTIRAATVRNAAYEKAYSRGYQDGLKSYRAPRYRGGGGYRGPSYSYGGIGEVASAFGIAQNYANATGSPVDLEIY